MNKKAQEMAIGNLISIAIVAIVGVILLVASAQNIGDVVNTIDEVNESISSLNGTTLVLLHQLSGKSVSSVVAFNSTGGGSPFLLTSGNYTIFNNQVVNGVETALFNATAEGTVWSGEDAGSNWNVSYTYQPTTYATSGGSRAVANLVVVFFAIAIAIVMLVPTLRSKVLESIR